MDRESLAKKKLPDSPGVYFFLGKNKKVLYIGKATSLKNRVNSYFVNNLKENRSTLIENMVSDATSIDYTVTDSVLEALILESNLIRTHKPYYNTKSKDDKSYNHLIITNEEWPRVLVVRGRDLTEKYTPDEIKHEFGPFTSGTLFREALKIVRKLFKFYDTRNPIGTQTTKIERGKLDFNRQIGLYPDPEHRDEYLKTIRHVKLFFEGKKTKIITELEKEMNNCAKKELFEAAHIIKKKIFALKHIEDIALVRDDYKTNYDKDSFRVEAYDIAHLAGKDMVGAMVVVENSEPNKAEYRKFKIKTLDQANDPAALKEVLRRRFTHNEWKYPDLLVVDGNIIQKNAAEAVLKELNLTIPVVAVVKDDKHKATGILGNPQLTKKYKFDILLANAESHRFAIGFFRKRARKSNLGLN
jgi:excinuclease UvrABC nuclease subunit